MSGTVNRLWLVIGWIVCSPWYNRNGWLGDKNQLPTYLPQGPDSKPRRAFRKWNTVFPLKSPLLLPSVIVLFHCRIPLGMGRKRTTSGGGFFCIWGLKYQEMEEGWTSNSTTDSSSTWSKKEKIQPAKEHFESFSHEVDLLSGGSSYLPADRSTPGECFPGREHS